MSIDDAGYDADLLDDIPEVNATPWIPEQDGEGIQGIVIDTYEVPDRFHKTEMVPVVQIRDREGAFWAIHGLRSVLRSQIRAKDPQPGDLFAVKYIGEHIIRQGEFAGGSSFVYRTAIRRAAELGQHPGQPGGPVLTAVADPAGDPTAPQDTPPDGGPLPDETAPKARKSRGKPADTPQDPPF